MIGISEAILLSNLLVAITLLATTVFRAKIERDQIKIIIENSKAKDKLEKIKVYIELEKQTIIDEFGEPVYLFLKEVFCNEN